jgi:hypothetical protein
MTEDTSNNKNVRDDEIDLLDLFRRMGKTINRWFHALGRAFLISVVFLLKRWLPLTLSVVAGVVASYCFKMASDSSYSSDLVLRTNAVSTSDMISYVNRLHTYCIENNIIALNDAIPLNASQINNIIDIGAFWIIDKGRDGIPDFVDYNNKHNIYDSINIRMQDRLDIRVKIKSPQELSFVQNGIEKFIEKDSIFQQKNRVRVRQNKELLIRLNYDIVQLDSLQKVKYFEETRNMHPKSGGQIIFMQEQKTQLVYSDIYSLYSRKQNLESERDLYKGIVTVLSDFSIPARRENGTMYYGIRCIPVIFCLTLLILIILANRKKLEEVYRKY